jgi:hypothetical protein
MLTIVQVISPSLVRSLLPSRAHYRRSGADRYRRGESLVAATAWLRVT